MFQAAQTPSYANGLKWFKKMEKSGYLSLLSQILRTSKLIASLVLKKDKGNVLVECETGSDISILVVSLSLLLISKEMRTIQGFKDFVIHKLWILYGH